MEKSLHLLESACLSDLHSCFEVHRNCIANTQQSGNRVSLGELLCYVEFLRFTAQTASLLVPSLTHTCILPISLSVSAAVFRLALRVSKHCPLLISGDFPSLGPLGEMLFVTLSLLLYQGGCRRDFVVVSGLPSSTYMWDL